MNVKVRFAPSPTGHLHIGNARTALINWLFAKNSGGHFLLRFDDTDVERSSREYAAAIVADLAWLGIAPDEAARQSERFGRYDEISEKLKKNNRLYPCYETADELDRKRKRALAQKRPPAYDRAGLTLSGEDRARLEAEGRKPHWRFLLDDAQIGWDDLVRGPQSFEGGSLSDPVLIREDGSYLYTLPSVIDDIDFAITHVVRGEDHVANTAVQIQIFRALAAAEPRFGHHNLLVGAGGEGLSKRLGSLSLKGFREDGLEAMAVASLAATIGTSDSVAPHDDLAALAAQFDFAKLSRAPARFDIDELKGLNAKLLHQTGFAAVADRLAGLGVGGGEAFWLVVRGNIENLSQARTWWDVVSGEIAPVIEDADLCAGAAELLPDDPLGEESWGAWTGAVKAATGAKGRALFHPLRLALTGRESGPELKYLLPLIGRQRAHRRLLGKTA